MTFFSIINIIITQKNINVVIVIVEVRVDNLELARCPWVSLSFFSFREWFDSINITFYLITICTSETKVLGKNMYSLYKDFGAICST